MKTLVGITTIVLAAFIFACSDEEELVSSTMTQLTTATTALVESTSSPSPTASSASSTPTPATPAPTAVPTRTPPPEADDQQYLEVGEIMATLPELPDRGNWKIVYTGDLAVGFVQVWTVDPPSITEFQQWIIQAQDWFRENGQEPCQYPLLGVVLYTATRFPPEPSTWEPCD